jgi:predicted Zn-dependent peptidase
LEFLEKKLPNGLTIVAERNPEAYSTALGFFVETGARDETEALAGVSHFLEHMVFKGTPTRSAEDVNREFDEMGAHYNAFTSEENTVYYAAVLPEHQTGAVELLADILRPSLRDEDFDTEKKVILEEIKMYEDQPPFGADEKCKAAHFGQHPLGRSVLGTSATVGALSVDAMRDYFRRRYSPGNITLVGSGRVDFDELVKTADRLCGAWQPVSGARDQRPAVAHSGLQCLHKDSATLEYVVQLSNGPDSRARERFAAKVLTTVVGDDSGSRLYWALVDSGLAEHASLNHYDYQGTGLFMTYMTCEADQTSANLAEIARIYRQSEAEGILPAELNQVKSKINSRVVLSSERPRGRLFTVGGNWLQRREYRSVADDLASVDAVTIDDVAGVLAKFPLSVSTTVAIGPLTTLNGSAATAVESK